jgi:hypothetical protein
MDFTEFKFSVRGWIIKFFKITRYRMPLQKECILVSQGVVRPSDPQVADGNWLVARRAHLLQNTWNRAV